MKLPELQIGDHLLYGPHNLFGYVTCIKTWSSVCHIEIYAGGGKSYASRDGIGVNEYPLRVLQLKYVLRPNSHFFFLDGKMWFHTYAKGQQYDWKGLLCFTLAVKQGDPNKMFCSEFAKRFDKHMLLKSFNDKWDADKTAPADFLKSPAFDWIYCAK